MDSTSTWRNNSIICEYLALSLACPTEELLASIKSGDFDASTTEIRALLGLAPISALADEIFTLDIDHSSEALRTLRAEYTRLFVGAPTPLIRPYESSFRLAAEGRTDIVLMVNPYAQKVEDFYFECGLKKSTEHNMPADHVSSELEALCYLAGVEAGLFNPAKDIDAAALFSAFVRVHFQEWIPGFCDKTSELTRSAFYRNAADILKSVSTSL